MRTIVIGCGRVGAGLAESLSRAGHEVTILDVSTEAFSRLEPDFPGTAIRGDGTDEDVLRKAGAEGADAFLALTEGDNRNVMAAQVAMEKFAIERTIAKINDPVRAARLTRKKFLSPRSTNQLGSAFSVSPTVQAGSSGELKTSSREFKGSPQTRAKGVSPSWTPR